MFIDLIAKYNLSGKTKKYCRQNKNPHKLEFDGKWPVRCGKRSSSSVKIQLTINF